MGFVAAKVCSLAMQGPAICLPQYAGPRLPPHNPKGSTHTAFDKAKAEDGSVYVYRMLPAFSELCAACMICWPGSEYLAYWHMNAYDTRFLKKSFVLSNAAYVV